MKSTFKAFCAVIVTALFVILFISPVSAMTIVKNHQPHAAIIVNSKASSQVNAAAKTLQTYIEKSTGATLLIRNTPGNDININVGETDYTKSHSIIINNLDQDGFMLQGTDDKNFVIIGGSDWGTEYGVDDFLERYLDVRWLAGGDLFTDIPQHTTVDIAPTLIRQNPTFLSRSLSPMIVDRNYSENPRWNNMPWSTYKMYDKWARFNRFRGRIEFTHNAYHLFPPSIFAKTHPEFYPMLKGKRIIPTTDAHGPWQPNFSAPGIVDAAAEQIEKYFSENPTASSYSLGVNDTHHFDESPDTIARRKALGGLPDEYAKWVNDVTGKVLLQYPDKMFGFLAYIELREPPQNIKYDSSVVPFVTYELSRWSDPQSRQFAQNLALKWLGASKNLGWYDYFYGSHYLVPRSLAHTEQSALLWLSEHGVKYYYGEDTPNFGEGPKDWVQSKLLWNPNQDVNALLNDWCTHAVGQKAAPKLEAYYALWEKFWSQDVPKSSWYNRKSDYQFFLITSYLLDVPREYVAQSDQLLDAAVQLADTPQHKERALKLQQMWKIYKASVIARQGDEYWKNADLQTETQAVDFLNKCVEAISESQDRLQMLSDLRNDQLYGHSVYRITVSEDKRGSDWGATSLWSLLPWVNKSAEVKSALEKIADKPQKPLLRFISTGKEIPMENNSAQIAAQVLSAANGGAKQLLRNPSFEEAAQDWKLSPGFIVSKDVASEGSSSILAKGINPMTAQQSVPYEPGTYYAIFHAYTPKSTFANVSLSLTAVNQQGRQRGRNLPSGTLTLHAGKWSTFIVPVTLGDLKVTDKMSLQVTVGVEKQAADDKIYLDNIELYCVNEL